MRFRLSVLACMCALAAFAPGLFTVVPRYAFVEMHNDAEVEADKSVILQVRRRRPARLYPKLPLPTSIPSLSPLTGMLPPIWPSFVTGISAAPSNSGAALPKASAATLYHLHRFARERDHVVTNGYTPVDDVRFKKRAQAQESKRKMSGESGWVIR
jgi:hypothetical protein